MTTELPRHLTEEQVEEIAKDCETLLEFTQEVRIGRHDARSLLYQLDIDAEFDRPAYELVRQSSQ